MKKRSAFGRVFRRKGRPGYYVRVRLKGREIVRWAGPDRKTAAEFLAQMLRATSREHLLGEKAVASVTFGEFEPVLLAHFRARHSPSTVESETGRLKRIVDWFGSQPIKDIGAGQVQDFLTALRNDEGHSQASANRYSSLLSVAFKLAIEKGCARQNPVRDIRRPREERRPVPFLGNEDIAKLVEATSEPRFGAFVRVLADTGLRRGEALALEWRDVDFNRGRVLVRRSKNRLPREVDLTGKAHETLKWLHSTKPAVPMSGPDYVWPEKARLRPQAVSSAFKTVAQRAGYEGLRLHDLRHAFCSRLAQANVPLPTISRMAGHTSWLTTQRYAEHLPEGATRAAITAMEQNETAAAEPKESGAKGA